MSIDELGFFEGNIVATLRNKTPDVPEEGILLLAKVETDQDDSSITITGKAWDGTTPDYTFIADTPRIPDPDYAVSLEAVGMESSSEATDTAPVRIEVCFAYTNRLGSTLTNSDSNGTQLITTKYVELSPALWTTKRYVRISGQDNSVVPGSSVSGIDIYARELENIDWVFVGHVDVTPAQGGISWKACGR